MTSPCSWRRRVEPVVRAIADRRIAPRQSRVDALVMQEEPFGAIAPIAAFADIDDVLARANGLQISAHLRSAAG